MIRKSFSPTFSLSARQIRQVRPQDIMTEQCTEEKALKQGKRTIY